MLVIIGWVVVTICVFGSFILGGGHILALLQPFEFMCIFGAAIGAFVVSNPPKTLRACAKAVPSCFKNTDFMVPDFGFYFMDNGSGYIGELDTDNVG